MENLLTTKHSPFIRRDAARRAYNAAEAACPHWSFEGFDANEEHECCREMFDAQRELSLARRACRVQS